MAQEKKDKPRPVAQRSSKRLRGEAQMEVDDSVLDKADKQLLTSDSEGESEDDEEEEEEEDKPRAPKKRAAPLDQDKQKEAPRHKKQKLVIEIDV